MKKRMIVSVFLRLLIVWALTVLVAATDMETYGKKSLQNDLRFSSVVGPGGNGSNAGGTVSVRPFTVTFDANGGTVEPATKTYRVLRGVYGELPTPFREGYAFAGWYTELDGGTQVNSGTTLSRIDHTLYALWEETGIIGSGNCGADGDNLTWVLTSDYTLTVSGNGDMANYRDADGERAPWYSYAESITTTAIESGVTSIGNTAFLGFHNLESLTIPNSVTSIGSFAFAQCGFATITIPDSVKTIGDAAFISSDIESVIIPDGVTKIQAATFQYCSCLKSITIPVSVTAIEGAFYLCELSNVYYGGTRAQWDTVTIDGDNNVLNNAEITCKGDVSAEILDSGYCGGEGDGKNLSWTFDSEGTLTISGTGMMESYLSQNGLQSPAWWRWCNDIKDVRIQNGITTIGSAAFFDCRLLDGVFISDSVITIGEFAFSGCEKLKSIALPNSVTSLGDAAFKYSGLQELQLPDSLISIGTGAIRETNITSIIIPDSVINVGGYAFFACKNLRVYPKIRHLEEIVL